MLTSTIANKNNFIILKSPRLYVLPIYSPTKAMEVDTTLFKECTIDIVFPQLNVLEASDEELLDSVLKPQKSNVFYGKLYLVSH